MKQILKAIYHDAFKKNHRKEDVVTSFLREPFKSKKVIEPSHNLFDVNSILKSSQSCARVLHLNNSFYGTERDINEYSKHLTTIKACIEHGVYFGSYVSENEYLYSGFSSMMTFSSVRKEHIRRYTNKPVFIIGPYIAYAKSLLSNEEILDKKKELGKTLLVFPSHSTDYAESRFDFSKMANEIDKIKTDGCFSSVIINLFWKDATDQTVEFFKKLGYIVSCCGNQKDPFFLSRLKSLILLSDLTMSNSVSTNLGYCIYLNKPHFFFNQKVELIHGKSNSLEYSDDCTKTRYLEKKEISDLFLSPTTEITKEQKNICSKYWGFDFVVSADQMLLYLNFLDRVDLIAHKKENNFRKAFIDEMGKTEYSNFKKILISSLG